MIKGGKKSQTTQKHLTTNFPNQLFPLTHSKDSFTAITHQKSYQINSTFKDTLFLATINLCLSEIKQEKFVQSSN